MLACGPAPHNNGQTTAAGLIEAQQRLRRIVLDSLPSANSRRNYGKALDDLFAFSAGRPLTRALVMEYRASIEALSASTINVRLSAMRKLVDEARKNGILSAEEAGHLTDIPNIRQQGTRLGNWLTREQARELLAVPDRSTTKGKRDYVMHADRGFRGASCGTATGVPPSPTIGTQQRARSARQAALPKRTKCENISRPSRSWKLRRMLVSIPIGNIYVMIALMIVVQEYIDGTGRNPFGMWFSDLDSAAAVRVTVALERIAHGHRSAMKGVGEGVLEYKIDFGPGYRVYFGKDGDRLVILVGGGTKKRQIKDIEAAHLAWKDYKRRKRQGE